MNGRLSKEWRCFGDKYGGLQSRGVVLFLLLLALPTEKEGEQCRSRCHISDTLDPCAPDLHSQARTECEYLLSEGHSHTIHSQFQKFVMPP